MPWADWMTSVHTEELLMPFSVLLALVMTFGGAHRALGYCGHLVNGTHGIQKHLFKHH